MDKRLTIERRIEAELMSYDGTMGIYADDFHGNVIAIGADEPFDDGQHHKDVYSGVSV